MSSGTVTSAAIRRATSEEERRIVARDGIIANFRFFNGISEEIFEGITIDISSRGFGFLTQAGIKEGQTLTITEHMMPDVSGRKAFIKWLKKGPRYFEAGARYISDV
jgi:hypothetical protein